MNGSISELFPYSFRDNQKEIVENIEECLNRGKSLIYQAATGSGKTVCSLVPVLDYAAKNDKKVIYLTRTNSQQRQVLYELRNLDQDFYGLGFQGRHNLCILAQGNEELQKGDPEELSKYCSDRKKEVREEIKENKESYSCEYYAGLLNCDIDDVRRWAKEAIPTVDEFLEYCEQRNLCAYELSKILVQDALLVTAPYIYFFLTYIRRRLLEWMNVELPDVIVVVDEAHNLPDYARDLASIEMTTTTLERAIDESNMFGDPDINDNTTISSFCRLFENILLDTVEEFVVDEDGLIPPNEIKTELLHSLSVNSNQFKSIIKDIKIQGEIVQEHRRKEKKLPRSYIHSIASFLKVWMSLNRAEYIKLVNRCQNPSLEGYCLDPSKITEVLNNCHSSIHQSATLEPLDEYRDSIGLPYDTDAKIYKTPFPEENSRIYYMKSLTTKYEVLQKDERMVKKYQKELEDIVKKVDQNMIIFFPSYRLMNEIGAPFLERAQVFVEQQKMTQPMLMDMVEVFKKEGGKIFCVIGGRISEGMDFPGKELEVAVIVGIPYPKPTARQKGLQHYYDMKFNKGWEYTVKAPTVRKILQATGRLLRSETDLGASVILDERAIHFQQYLHDIKLTENPAESIISFFEEKDL